MYFHAAAKHIVRVFKRERGAPAAEQFLKGFPEAFVYDRELPREYFTHLRGDFVDYPCNLAFCLFNVVALG
jgi:hypothetical protein